MFGIIYKATNKINNKFYIGQTCKNIIIRKNRHIADALNMRNNIYFHNAINKYGPENFTWEVLEYCDSKEELDEMEFHFIKQYNSMNIGYNRTLGGEGSFGYKHNDAAKVRMSTAALKTTKHVNRGKHLSDDWKSKIRESNKGRSMPEHVRLKMIKSKTGKFRGAASPYAKKFVITAPDNTSFVVNGLCDFTRKYNETKLDFRLLSAVAYGKRTHHKGYKCRHFDVFIDNGLKIWS